MKKQIRSFIITLAIFGTFAFNATAAEIKDNNGNVWETTVETKENIGNIWDKDSDIAAIVADNISSMAVGDRKLVQSYGSDDQYEIQSVAEIKANIELTDIPNYKKDGLSAFVREIKKDTYEVTLHGIDKTVIVHAHRRVTGAKVFTIENIGISATYNRNNGNGAGAVVSLRRELEIIPETTYSVEYAYRFYDWGYAVSHTMNLWMHPAALKIGDLAKPYLGGGMGVSYTHYKANEQTNVAWALVGQLGAGVELEVAESVGLDIGYRMQLRTASVGVQGARLNAGEHCVQAGFVIHY